MSIVIRPSDVETPLDPVRLFGREGPLVLEVGFGNGEFLTHLAERFQDWNILGADTSPSSVVRARKRIRRGSFENIRLYSGDARYVVRNMVAAAGLHRAYVLFPDPWPRRRHAPRRLLSSAFLTLLASRLTTDGVLSLTTDHLDYFEFARQSVAATGLFREEVGEPPTEMLETRWARRWLDQDRPIYHALFCKTADPPKIPGRQEKTDMQHALMRGDLSTVARFEKEAYVRDGATIVLADAYRSLDGSAMIFLAMVEEDDLHQNVVIEARPKGEDILIGVTKFGKPLSTRGLNQAVSCVAEYLASQGLEVLESRY